MSFDCDKFALPFQQLSFSTRRDALDAQYSFKHTVCGLVHKSEQGGNNGKAFLDTFQNPPPKKRYR
jgi:hypothetical protein